MSRTDRDELIILRESLTRVAHALELQDHVPGGPHGSYAEIHKAASSQDRGWNALCARIISEIEQRNRSVDTPRPPWTFTDF